MEPSDEQLILAAREGDDGALALLIRRYLTPVYQLAFGISAAIGILFGYYPAHRASLLNPIEALRYE